MILFYMYAFSELYLYSQISTTNAKYWSIVSICLFVCFMVFNATFKNISVMSWRSVLFVEETGRSAENHRPVTSFWQTYHIMLYTSLWSRFELTTSVVIGTDCIGSCKSNYRHDFPVSICVCGVANNIRIQPDVWCLQISVIARKYVFTHKMTMRPVLF